MQTQTKKKAKRHDAGKQRNPLTPYGIKGVKGYPDRLQIYRIDASPAWQMRVYTGGKYKRKSSGTGDEKTAVERAKAFYDEVVIAERGDVSLFPTKFRAIASEYQQGLEADAKAGRISERKLIEERRKLKADIIPFFGDKQVESIDELTLEEYRREVLDERGLSSSTCTKHFLIIAAVLKLAKKKKILKSIPETPKIKSEQLPRSYFSEPEYKRLWRRAVTWGNQKLKVRIDYYGEFRHLFYTREFSDFLVFSTNIFIRLSDTLKLRHRQITIIEERGEEVLQISVRKGKTRVANSLSMPQAAKIYRRLLKRHEQDGKGIKPDDFVFYPEHPNREYALDNLNRMFNHIVVDLGIKTDTFGVPRTLYSLRHTALVYRFLYMDPVDIFLIAKNALTSVEMLEKFYLAHLDTRMKLAQLISKRKV